MKLKIDIANFFFISIVLEIILHYFIPIKQIINSPYTYIGLGLFILGWIPNIWLYFAYKKAGNLINSVNTPNKLITIGFFRISRNPNYLGMVVALLGEAIFVGSLVTFIIPVLFFILINKFNINYEEQVLEKKFGKKYLEYKSRVRRWI